MKYPLIACTLLATTLLFSCKKDKDTGVEFNGTANEISGEWMMNPATVTGDPAGTIVPKYQFGTNSRYSFTQGLHPAPRRETGKYMVVQRPPIGYYVVVFTPDNAAEYNLELHIQSPTTAMFGARMFHRVK
ncbi:hypothetical protein ACQKLP_22315 [Chitinophaga sp. NPDC101104]|uniref:hypothetical protein n=1 Tax=Chitinophaga sp. NPDC101104 TaxID=3390561 RepID=UPI003D0281AF